MIRQEQRLAIVPFDCLLSFLDPRQVESLVPANQKLIMRLEQLALPRRQPVSKHGSSSDKRPESQLPPESRPECAPPGPKFPAGPAAAYPEPPVTAPEC